MQSHGLVSEAVAVVYFSGNYIDSHKLSGSVLKFSYFRLQRF